MKFKTEFKNVMDRARYLAKLIKLLPQEGEQKDFRDVNNYQIKYSERTIEVRFDDGETMGIAWGGGELHKKWSTVLDMLLEDVKKELKDNLEILSALGLMNKGINLK